MFQHKPNTGLDIGADSVKLAAVTGDGREATALWQDSLLAERRSRDDILDEDAWLKRLVTVIRTYLLTYPGVGREFSMAVPGESMIYHYIELPRLKKQEAGLAITAQAYKLLPIQPEISAITSLEVPPLKAAKDVTAALVTAVAHDTLQRMRQVLESCGVVPGRLEVPVLALTRELFRNRAVDRGRFYGLVHVGFRLTRVAVVRDGFPYYAREFMLAGRDFTYAFQMAEQCSWLQAEELKLSCDLNGDVNALEPFLRRWMDEVRKSLRALQAKNPDVEVARIFLSGGSAALKNLAGRLAAHLQLPVELDIWECIQVAPPMRPAAAFKVAVGLGLVR